MSVKEAKKDLRILQAEATVVNRRIKEIEEELERLKTRHQELCGSTWGRSSNGEIHFAQQRVEQAERNATDAIARKVVWVDDHAPYTGHDDKVYVVDKITPKRIYIRIQGSSRSVYYNKDGTNNSEWTKCRIDIYKTFPEGLDEYAKANKRRSS
jgi:hypothetical protein